MKKMEFIQSFINYNIEKLMNSAIIVAAGKGSRLVNNSPKQFMKLNQDKTILDFSIEAFKKNKFIHEIIIVTNSNWIEKIQDKYQTCKVIKGGKSRSESSFIGLNECNEKCKNVLIHDAARPFVTQKIINECINNLEKYHAVIPTLIPYDSLLDIDNNKQYLNRDKIRIVQTPQAFNYKKILNAYNNNNNNIKNDDMSVLLEYDIDVNKIFIKGDRLNFKITDKIDFDIARKLV